MQFKAIVFDLFGTLVDNLPGESYGEMMTEMAATLGAPRDDFSREWVATFDRQAVGHFDSWEANILHACQALNIEPAPDKLAQAATLLPAYVKREITPRPDAVDTIARLKEMGLKIGLISDCSMEIPIIWPELPFANLFDAPVFSCSVGVRKPDSRIYQIACERLQVQPAHCLYVGDGSSHELTGASKMGMTPVLISAPYDRNYDHYRQDAIEWQGPVISSLSEILQFVDGTSGNSSS